MYFPYLRGKQFEMIALRELCALFPDTITNISPIIEPVKLSSTLVSTLKELAAKGVNFNLIINPRVGDLIGQDENILEIIRTELKDYQNLQIGIIVDHKTGDNLDYMFQRLGLIDFEHNGFTLIHNYELASLNLKKIQELEVRFNVIYSQKTSRRYYREFPQETRVSLDDYFKDQARNADYLGQESVFSEEYRFYDEDGFCGFSDFLTIGDNYSETGFLPRAVAIHISYIKSDRKIWVKHFVSESNGDVSDIGGKFAEAVAKLDDWAEQEGITTQGVKKLQDFKQSGHFPGLGTLKKLSVMNHIELILNHI
ncbi:MAG: sce7725 family protein [Bacteroidota bacterium]|nr:sce7725 family protein [Bacteroidota bacterium]